MSRVWEANGIDGGEKLVLLCIADHAGDDGTCYPSVKRIAERSNMSERNVQYCVRSLRDKGWLRISYGQGRNGSNVYTVLYGGAIVAGVQSVQGEKVAPVQNTTGGGEIYDSLGVKPIAPKPSLKPSRTVIHNPAVDRLFEFYCLELGRDPKRYTLTPDRRKKAEMRLKERSALVGEEAAEEEAGKCISNLAASDYHREGGYIDWISQIFKSQEEFQKRLNWRKPTSNGFHQQVPFKIQHTVPE